MIVTSVRGGVKLAEQKTKMASASIVAVIITQLWWVNEMQMAEGTAKEAAALVRTCQSLACVPKLHLQTWSADDGE